MAAVIYGHSLVRAPLMCTFIPSPRLSLQERFLLLLSVREIEKLKRKFNLNISMRIGLLDLALRDAYFFLACFRKVLKMKANLQHVLPFLSLCSTDYTGRNSYYELYSIYTEYIQKMWKMANEPEPGVEG